MHDNRVQILVLDPVPPGLHIDVTAEHLKDLELVRQPDLLVVPDNNLIALGVCSLDLIDFQIGGISSPRRRPLGDWFEGASISEEVDQVQVLDLD